MADDERKLVERAKLGDAAAFGLIYQRHVDRVFAYIDFRVRDRALAEDLTQDVFLQVMRRLEQFEWRGGLAPWLMRIARNTVVDHWRRVGRRPERTQTRAEAGEMDEDETSLLERLAVTDEDTQFSEAEAASDRERLARATAQLTELQQRVLALRFAAGLSIQETAEAMGRSEGAIKNLQHHAVRGLRRLLEEEAWAR